MKKEKNLSYYRNLLHKDGIALLVVAVIFTIASFLFMLQDGYSGDLSVPIFLKSIMFIVLSAILVCNKKETKKFIGILTIIISCLMILTSIGDGSLFGIVYFEYFPAIAIAVCPLCLKIFPSHAVDKLGLLFTINFSRLLHAANVYPDFILVIVEALLILGICCGITLFLKKIKPLSICLLGGR